MARKCAAQTASVARWPAPCPDTVRGRSSASLADDHPGVLLEDKSLYAWRCITAWRRKR